MTAVSYPGVYVEEIPGGARPIEAASTATAAFIGVAEKGPDDKAVRVTSWDQFQKTYGSFISSGHLAESVFQFFNNGGRQCYIIRVAGSAATAATVTVPNRQNLAAVKIAASSKGSWGNSVYVWVRNGSNSPGDTFRVSVFMQSDPMSVVSPEIAAAATPIEDFDDLSVDPESKDYFVTRINDGSSYIQVDLPLLSAPEIAGYHVGKWMAGTVTLGTNRKLLINVDGDGFQQVQLGSALAAASSLADIATEIRRVVSALVPQRLVTSADAFGGFRCTVDTNPADATQVRLHLTSGTTGAGSSVQVRAALLPAENAITKLKIGETEGGVSFGGLSDGILAVGTYQVGDEPAVAPITSEAGVDDNDSLIPPIPYQNAMHLLDRITDVSMLAVPGVPGMFDVGVNYCQNLRPLRDIFFIGEVDSTDDTPAEGEIYRKRIAMPNTYGALFFPWIKSPDPRGLQKDPVLMPPSGFMAGLFARIDGTRGVWKAPAGTEATVAGAVGLAAELGDVEQGNLNTIGVNVIRRFDLAGIVCWGARTVYSDPEYKYVPVRRTAIMLRKSIYDGIQWAVFEPNDHRLWSALRLNIGAFMNGLFRAGAFQGETASDAYFVRCGLGDTMTQDDIDRGQAIVLVGFAPLKPAEFVIVRIQQKAGQS